MLFFEDIEIGEKTRLGTYTFTEAEIVAFARAWDPQPFHLDAAAGARTHFGGLVASGWQTAVISSKLRAEACARLHETLQREGRKVPRIGPSPGFKDLRWLKPIHAGDTITFTRTAVSYRALASKPGWLMLLLKAEAFNERQEPVMEMENSVLVAVRD